MTERITADPDFPRDVLKLALNHDAAAVIAGAQPEALENVISR